MLIRQNPARQKAFAPETAHLCARLARQIIESHDVFISAFPNARATGYFTTCSIVECIYHLALVLHHSQDETKHAASVAAFHLAHEILVRLSPSNKVANKALQALRGVVKRWGSFNSQGRADGATTENTIADNNVRPPLLDLSTGKSLDFHFLDDREADVPGIICTFANRVV